MGEVGLIYCEVCEEWTSTRVFCPCVYKELEEQQLCDYCGTLFDYVEGCECRLEDEEWL